jgi:hypothetical protein
MAIQSKFANAKDAAQAGWYSRRHETREESQAQKEKHPYTGKRGRRGNHKSA